LSQDSASSRGGLQPAVLVAVGDFFHGLLRKRSTDASLFGGVATQLAQMFARSAPIVMDWFRQAGQLHE